METIEALRSAVLPWGYTGRFFEGVNGLRMQVLEAGARHGRPMIPLLHGFPELAVHLVKGAGHWVQQERPDAV